MNSKVKTLFILHLFLMVYSTGGIISKLAAGKPFMSLPFILLYAGEIVILAFYAIGWQQFIKRMPLSAAYANKAVTVIWGCIWGALIFHENLTVGKIIGCLIVLVGVALFGYADGKMSSNTSDISNSKMDPKNVDVFSAQQPDVSDNDSTDGKAAKK